MKKELLLLAFCASTSVACGQVVTETVDFNTYTSPTNNDLVNKFSLSYALPQTSSPLTQVTTGGITGGALVPPTTSSYANDYAAYCYSYQNTLGTTTATSICFKYNASLVNPNSFTDPVDFFVNTHSGDNLFLGLRRDYRLSSPFYLSILTNSSSKQLTIANAAMITGHWYQVVVRFKPIGGTFNDQCLGQVELLDLGSSGTATPLSVGLVSQDIYRPLLVSMPSYEMNFMGNKWGGAELLDNFSFSGNKGGSICTALATKPAVLNPQPEVVPNPAAAAFAVALGDTFAGSVEQVQLVDVIGKVLAVPYAWSSSTKSIQVDARSVATGTYVVLVQTSTGVFRRKVTLE